MARSASLDFTDGRQRKMLSKVTFQICFALSLFILSHLSSVDASSVQKREAESEDGSGGNAGLVSNNVTVPAENQTNTNNITDMGDNNKSSSSNTGAVVAASVIAVMVCIGIVLAVYILKRRRQSRMMDKEKKMQIQMSSARNAGVYQDLTVSVPAEDKPPASPEHERLKSAEEA